MEMTRENASMKMTAPKHADSEKGVDSFLLRQLSSKHMRIEDLSGRDSLCSEPTRQFRSFPCQACTPKQLGKRSSRTVEEVDTSRGSDRTTLCTNISIS